MGNDQLERRWGCINSCNTYECIGIPSYCPYCGTREVYPAADDVELVENRSEVVYVNESE